MVSWQGSLGRFGNAGRVFIGLLLDDNPVTGEGSPQTLRDKKIVESGEGRQGGPRGADLHAGAGCRIEHPGGYLDDQARLYLN
ncbi:MAG: hypothetical protein OXG99_08640 [Alphaproteobacteria bacterium]|nr:hypothetical protein [Alphaproteobacteria bacterium]